MALRTSRWEAGLTQEALARRAGVGVRTVRELERGRVLRPQRGTVDLLARALGLAGAELDAFVTAARRDALADPAARRDALADPAARRDALADPAARRDALADPAARRDALADPAARRDALADPAAPRDAADPAAGPEAPVAPAARNASGAGRAVPGRPDLIGREAEVAQLGAILGEGPRVVTLTGLAGVGKTCLASAMAHKCAQAFAAGATELSISDGSRSDDILAAVASAFAVNGAADLIERCAGTPGLLVVDAADRSPQATVEAIRWLRSRAPALTILVTSRHPLKAPGAVHRRVEPLGVPPRGDNLASLRTYAAVELFLARLYEVRPEPPTDSDAPVLAELVRVLGGLPLALELAAARARVLELPELLERYRDRVLDLGAVAEDGPTLRDALDGSYRLLSASDQWALRQLSVLRGDWSMRLAEELLAADRRYISTNDDGVRPTGLDVEAVMDRLVGLGLVNVRPSGANRFWLLDMVRDFAAEQRAEHRAAGRAEHRAAERAEHRAAERAEHRQTT
jgi:predicted ATPase/transcriptional regulator with XRE-family HTH domain